MIWNLENGELLYLFIDVLTQKEARKVKMKNLAFTYLFTYKTVLNTAVQYSNAKNICELPALFIQAA